MSKPRLVASNGRVILPVTYVYAIGSWDGPVKFGVSENPWKRLAQIQTTATFKLELLRAQPSNTRDEAILDEQFLHTFYTEQGKHLFGEWFQVMGIEAAEAVRDAVSHGNHFRSEARRAANG